MIRIISLVFLFSVLNVLVDSNSMPMRMMAVKPGDKLEIEYYNPTKISRFVKNAKGVEIEHVFRVCNGKNKAKCGYWENVKTKKKVARTTTYNKKKNILTVPKMKAADAGTYRDNNYDTVTVYVM
ncbi:hypothetical protein CRE_24719 [Caenorhabditis remanei]|uniref:Uncharacterized protein n=1 Tax=Caenorhabditis remanei TaxID=31234 RepID=E3N3Z5_CAERE|nr:hypothetical protein CRE_24719 [Caenorhabditis remanei]